MQSKNFEKINSFFFFKRKVQEDFFVLNWEKKLNWVELIEERVESVIKHKLDDKIG